MLKDLIRLRGKPELGRQQLRHVGQRVRLGPRPLLRLHPLQPGRQEHRVPAARPLRQVDGNDGYHGGCGMRYGDDDARTGFDTAYMVTNEETTGLLSYVGEKHTTVQYDQTLYQVSSLDISCDGKFSVVSHIMISAANRLIGEVVQTRRRPLLGPSPG